MVHAPSRALLARLYGPQRNTASLSASKTQTSLEKYDYAIDQVGVDAAILFSDILVIAQSLDFRW